MVLHRPFEPAQIIGDLGPGTQILGKAKKIKKARRASWLVPAPGASLIRTTRPPGWCTIWFTASLFSSLEVATGGRFEAQGIEDECAKPFHQDLSEERLLPHPAIIRHLLLRP